MKPSLRSGLAKVIFLLVTAAVAVSILVIEWFFDGIEEAILELELHAEAAYFREVLLQEPFQSLKTARMEIVFLPEGQPETLLPEYFRFKSVPYSTELKLGDQTFLIYAEQLENPAGRLFLAQDITLMESRESLILVVLVGLFICMFILAFFVSQVSARYLVRPLKKLAKEVQATEPGYAMRRIFSDYGDREFTEIAEAFNRFLSELESHIEREQSFVKLASHELRTPLAVISGALNVLEQRGHFSDADQKTLNRIHMATRTMKDDISVLLELARNEALNDALQEISLSVLIREMIADLEFEHAAHQGRISFQDDSDDQKIKTHPALARMLLRNLLQNALRHTHSRVEVRLAQGVFSVRDFGEGLPSNEVIRLTRAEDQNQAGSRPVNFRNATFGLLIVRLVCDRLGWVLELVRSDNEGTEYRILVATPRSF